MKPTLYRVLWEEIWDSETGRTNECWEESKTRKQAQADLRSAVEALNQKRSLRGIGPVTKVVYSEVYE